MSYLEQFRATPDGQRLLCQERLVLRLATAIDAALKARKMSRADLARKLGTSKGNVTQLLSGKGNLTVRRIADILFALGYELKVQRTALDGSAAGGHGGSPGDAEAAHKVNGRAALPVRGDGGRSALRPGGRSAALQAAGRR